MKTSEVLNRAADLIEERGWSMGSGWDDDGKSPLCAEGAIAAAMGKRSGVGNVCPAYRAVREYIDDKPVFLWNDHAPWVNNDWRSYQLLVPGDYEASVKAGGLYVLATLRAVALVEAAKENTGAVARMSEAVS